MMERKKRVLRRGETARVIKTALDNGAGDLDLAEVSLADMDPQDIRVSFILPMIARVKNVIYSRLPVFLLE